MGTIRECLVAAFAAAVILPTGSAAQTRPETIRGRVTSPDSQPIADASVVAVMAPARAVFQTRTDSSGAYGLHVPDGTGDYLLHVTKIGTVAFVRRITRTGADSVFVVDVKLAPIAQRLAGVRVEAQKPKPIRTADPGTEIGAAEKIADNITGALSPEQVGDLAATVATIPGFMPVGGGISVLGLDPSQNRATINGMGFSGGSIPRAAQVSVRASTTTYDPSRGWFGGAQTNVELGIASVFSSRRAYASVDAPALQYTDRVSSRLGQRFTSVSASLGGSGPVDSRDRFFYNYGVQGGRRVANASSLVTADADLLRHAGVASDSITALLGILRAAHVPTTLSDIPASLVVESGSALARLDLSPYDWKTLTPSKMLAGITVFGDWTRARPLSLSPTVTPAHSGERSRVSLGTQLLLSTYLHNDFLSTTRTGLSVSDSRTAPYLDLPNATVLVASQFSDGVGGVNTLQFGGDGASSGSSRRWSWETMHETQFYAQNRRSLHRVKLSADVLLDGYTDDVAPNRLGTFSFASLADIAASRPSSFSRVVEAPVRRGAEWNAYAAVGDLWKVTPRFSLQYGARLEGNRFVEVPQYNAAVERSFGTRNDAAPNTMHLSPRLGFTWVRGGAGNIGAITFNRMGQFNMGPTSYLRGGIGEFRSMLPATLLSDARVQTGLPGGSRSISCVGTAVPIPQWQDYNTNASTIPSACASSSPDFSQSVPGVRLLARDYTAARSWRGNLSYSSQHKRLMYSIDGTYSLNVDQPGWTDLNLATAAAFTSAVEGRTTFAPASAFVQATGAVSRAPSRRVAGLDQVIESRSDLRSVSKQLIVTASPDLYRVSNWILSTSYVLATTRSLENGFVGTSFGSPFDRDWVRGPYDARHQFLVQAGYGMGGVTLSLFARVASGLPFTPLVGGDVNGDGVANDRAFIFDPSATADARVASAMRSLLASASPAVRACLHGQLGAAAGARSCEGPWTASVNAALSTTGEALHIPKRVVRVQLALSNPLGGLDLMLHGSGALRGWGRQSVPEPVLYNVRAFDQATRRFAYEVNPRFGNTNPALSTARAPFRATLDVTLNLSRDPALQQLERYLRPGRAGHAGPRLTVDELKRRYERNDPNPYLPILQLSDSLLLTPAQMSAIQQVQVRYKQRMDSLFLSLATEFAALGDTYDVPAAVKRQEGATDDAMEIARVDVRENLPRILTPIQMSILPFRARTLLDSPGPLKRSDGRTLTP